MKIYHLMTQRCWLFFAMACCCYQTTVGQNNNDTLGYKVIKKNTIHAAAGTIGVAGAYNLNYERLIVNFEKGTLEGLWAKASYGGWGVWSVGGPYQSLSLGILTGKKNSHLELNAGGGRMVLSRRGYDNGNTNNFYFTVVGAAGYRYQKPGGKFLFRCGIAKPETIYVGLGFAF